MHLQSELESSLQTGLSAELIERDRQKWALVIEKLNGSSDSVKYALKRSDDEGYYYIVPELCAQELVYNGTKRKIPKEWTINFSDKQFAWDPYHSWLNNPKSDFILDMYPHNSGNKAEYVGRFSFHPFSRELILSRLLSRHAVSIEQFGNHGFNEYMRGIYLRDEKMIILRAYYDPRDGDKRFNERTPEFDSNLNELVTNTTIDMLIENGMPAGTKIIRNADNRIVKEYTHIV